ncbi:hypothetical protein BCR44DRAFT_1501653 [Catenaria anguillulae PL171]|uniref:Uncharacterized protein n=1 Tax=Catenaria anguillulae PL171 TaxID=765915 RepID=A0A1Y2HEI5_9FUNG|nr:hypothetical protein BCR44DRAFT_1501653 [Catenaria anguillulae PL171]
MFPQAPPEATVCAQAIDRASAFGHMHNLDGWLNKSSWPFGYSGRALEPRNKHGYLSYVWWVQHGFRFNNGTMRRRLVDVFAEGARQGHVTELVFPAIKQGTGQRPGPVAYRKLERHG